MRIIKSLMSVLCGCLMVLVCSNSVLAVDCTGQYFGQSQCKLRTPLTGGSCQLNPDLGVINTVNPSDLVNQWKWSWCSYGPGCIPTGDNVAGCTYVKQNYSTQCTRDYYQDTHQQCSPIVSGSSMINHYGCSCFYESLQYDCGGVSRFLYLPQIGGNGKYAAFSYYNYEPTCYDTSWAMGQNTPGWVYTTEAECIALCLSGVSTPLPPTPTPTIPSQKVCEGKYFGEPQCRTRVTSKPGYSCQLNSALGSINSTNLADPINYWKWSYCNN